MSGRERAELLAVVPEGRRAPARKSITSMVEALVIEAPGITTRAIADALGEAFADTKPRRMSLRDRVSAALNKLKLGGRITPRSFDAVPYEWIPGIGPAAHGYTPCAPPSAVAPVPARVGTEVLCGCGVSILFGSLATAEERAEPCCSSCRAGVFLPRVEAPRSCALGGRQ